MRKNKETFIVCIRRVRLYLHLVLLDQFPVLTILQTGLNEDTILVRGEVLASDDLADEVDFWFVVSSGAHYLAHLLHLINLAELHVFQCLLVVCVLWAWCERIREHVLCLLDGTVLVELAWCSVHC